MRSFTWDKLMMALHMMAAARRDAPRIVGAQRPYHERYHYKAHQGAQEIARRQRQIAKGQLTRSNGLVPVERRA